jgi:hypothetical protein
VETTGTWRVMWSGLGAPIATRRVCCLIPRRANRRSETATQNLNSSSLETTSPRRPLVPEVAKMR